MQNSFIDQLRFRLDEPLPGERAQRAMAPRPVDEERFNFKERSDAKLGGVLALFYQDEEDMHLPLILRPTYDGAHSGQVSFPGGKKEPTDVDLAATALREAEEEIGIDGADVQVLGSLSEMYIAASNFKVLPVVGYLDYKPNLIPEAKEVKRIIQAPVSVFLDDETKKQKEITVGANYRIWSPYYDVDGEMIWGATAMMLSELMTLIKEIR